MKYNLNKVPYFKPETYSNSVRMTIKKIYHLFEKVSLPTGGLEPPIFGLGDRRLIHWATRADVETCDLQDGNQLGN